MNHQQLKRLIQKIISDAMQLPDLFTSHPVPPDNPEEPQLPFFDPKKYEQLVATAVLNRVSATRRSLSTGLPLSRDSIGAR